MEFVLVPAGPFKMGSDDGADCEKPVHEVHLHGYEIGRHPVTVAQFAAFVEATGRRVDPLALRDTGQFGDHPVTPVSWFDAVAFCAWASDVTGREVRLPTEAEWEKAARGTDGREYPWGNDAPTPSRCNFDYSVGHTTPVGAYSPLGDSPYGAADMAGNTAEWVADRRDDHYYLVSRKHNPQGSRYGDERVLRGGSFASSVDQVRAAHRHWDSPDRGHGFRCARSISS